MGADARQKASCPVASEGDPVRWLDDVSPAAWIGARLHPFVQDVGSIIPEGFEAHGRLFHPVEDGQERPRERWSDLARRNRRIVHPEMQFHCINRALGQSPPSGYEAGTGPSWGSLPAQERAILVEVLSRHTSTPTTCWFCVWEGTNPLDGGQDVVWVKGGTLRARLHRRQAPPELPPHPQVELPHRRYFLYGGSIIGAMAFDQSPHLWWPEDRSWFVATEVDYAWTYVGGTRHLIDELVADGRLEVLPAQLSDKPFYDADLLNHALDLGGLEEPS
jgi:hypothetical protein